MKRVLATVLTLIMVITTLAMPSVKAQAADKPGKATITVKLNDDGLPVISWKKVKGATGYRVYRKTENDSKWVKVSTTTKLKVTDKKVDAAPGSVVQYRVRTYVNETKKKTVWGAYSKTAKVTMPGGYQEILLMDDYGPLQATITSAYICYLPEELLGELQYCVIDEGTEETGPIEIRYAFTARSREDTIANIDVGVEGASAHYDEDGLRIYAPLGYCDESEDYPAGKRDSIVCYVHFDVKHHPSAEAVTPLAKALVPTIVDVTTITDPDNWVRESVFKK